MSVAQSLELVALRTLAEPLMAICAALLARTSVVDAVVLGNVETAPGEAFILDEDITVALSSNATTFAGGPTGAASGGLISIPATGLLTTDSLH